MLKPLSMSGIFHTSKILLFEVQKITLARCTVIIKESNEKGKDSNPQKNEYVVQIRHTEQFLLAGARAGLTWCGAVFWIYALISDGSTAVFQLWLSRACTASRPFLLLTPPHQGGLVCTRSWEGTRLAQLFLPDQRDIPDQKDRCQETNSQKLFLDYWITVAITKAWFTNLNRLWSTVGIFLPKNKI